MINRRIALAISALGLVAAGVAFATATFVLSQPATAYDDSNRSWVPDFAEGSAAIYPQQGDALSDGIVDDAENELAIQRTVDCVVAGGLIAEVTPGEGLRPTRVFYRSAADSGLSQEAGRQIIQTCQETYSSATGVVWGAQRSLPSTAAIAAHYDLVEQCLLSGGDPSLSAYAAYETVTYGSYIAAPATNIEIGADERQIYAECALAAESSTGLLSPAPVVIGD